jgi:pyridoxal phosphate enzyme (YggS family)
MHDIVKKIVDIENSVKIHLNKLNIENNPKIIAVSKTFKIDKILPLIEWGHLDYGENKVQEAVEKWTDIKKKHMQLRLHMIGKLQTNKVKFAVRVFDFIHSVDSKKLAKKISEEQKKINKKIKIFLQVNIGNENQKSGVDKNDLKELVYYCKELELDLIGLMCIPPAEKDPSNFFEETMILNKNFGFRELSMGMSNDYLKASLFDSTYLRIGSSIFGTRV